MNQLGQYPSATSPALRGTSHCEHQLVRHDAYPASGLQCRVIVGGEVYHRSTKVDPRGKRVLRLNETRVDVNEEGSTIADDYVCREGTVPMKIRAQRFDEVANLRDRDASLVTGTACAVRSLAWKATSEPLSNTD